MEKELEKKLIKKILLSPIMIGVFIFILAISVGTAYGAANYLYDSKDVKYDNSESGIVATNVQGAVDELYAAATDYSGINTRVTTLETQIYPVGSIYISVNNTNPSTLFGGTWERFGKGKTLVGLDEEDDDYNTSEGIGGAKNVTLTVNNLPSHSHSFTPAGSVTSSFSGTRTTTENAGSHTHTMTKQLPVNTFIGTSGYQADGATYIYKGDASGFPSTSSAGNHSHYYTPAGSVTSTFTGTASNTGYTGSGTALNTQDPYITVYMWKRTA